MGVITVHVQPGSLLCLFSLLPYDPSLSLSLSLSPSLPLSLSLPLIISSLSSLFISPSHLSLSTDQLIRNLSGGKGNELDEKEIFFSPSSLKGDLYDDLLSTANASETSSIAPPSLSSSQVIAPPSLTEESLAHDPPSISSYPLFARLGSKVSSPLPSPFSLYPHPTHPLSLSLSVSLVLLFFFVLAALFSSFFFFSAKYNCTASTSCRRHFECCVVPFCDHDPQSGGCEHSVWRCVLSVQVQR